jgi:O-antigen ligase
MASAKQTLVFAAGIILFYISLKAAQQERYRKYLEIILFLTVVYSLVIAGVALYQHFALQIIRPRSIVGRPTYAARYLELSVPIVIALLSTKDLGSRFVKGLLILALICLLGGLFVTFTRGAWVATTIVILLMIIVNKQYKWFALGVVAMLPATVSNNYGVNRLFSIFQLHHEHNIERLNGWTSSLQIIKDHPWTGIGFDTFKQVYPAYMLPQAREVLAHAHNTPLVLATEGGIFTALFFFCFFVAAMLYIIYGYRTIGSSYYRNLVLGLACAAVALMINGAVDYAFTRSGVWAIFIFQLGFCLGLVRCFGFKNHHHIINN